MSKRYREILPLPDSSGDGSYSGRSSSSTDPKHDGGKRKRTGTELACNECRRRKARCNGQKPTCDNCLRRDTVCVYADKDSSSGGSPESTRILNFLRGAPEKDAINILRFLRANGDPSTVISILERRGKAIQDASREGSNSMGGSSSSSSFGPANSYPDFDFELMTRNTVSYPDWRPPTVAELKRSNLLDPSPMHRTKSFDHQDSITKLPEDGSNKADGNYGDATPTLQNQPSDLDTGLTETLPPLEFSSMQFQPSTDDPFELLTQPNPTLCDPRLEELEMAFWTDVSIPDDLARRMISLYLETDHPLLGTFDPDLFVADLVAKRDQFCSRPLVAAVMYWSSTMYSAIDPKANEYIRRFEKAAERLWSTGEPVDSVLNLAASQLLSVAYLGHGRDHLVLKYVSYMNRMGNRLGLFGLDSSEAAEKLAWVSNELMSPACYAAWGAFNWIILMTVFYHQPGLEYPEFPPTLPVPGLSPKKRKSSKVGSDRDSSSPEPIPKQIHYMGETFPALCHFWRIMHGVTVRYYRDSTPRRHPRDYVTLEFAEHKFRELLAWAETLPPSLVQSDHCPHHVVIFHMWYHAAILDIFRPFIRPRFRRWKRQRLTTFSSKQSSPDAAYSASVNQLKRLILIYRSKYPSSVYTMLWHTALTYVANAVMQDSQDPEWRFYFLLCMYGYEGLRRAYRLAEVVGRGLLSMTLRNGDLAPEEARRILRHVQLRRIATEQLSDIRATFMVDLELAMTDPEDAKVESLAHCFDDMALFQEFTNVDGAVQDGQDGVGSSEMDQ